jgi:L,D-transpeptidase catalytic domain
VRRIGALGLRVFIRAAPSRSSPEIGTIALGGSVPLRSSEPLRRPDCPSGWYAVEPAGHVCFDALTTLDADTHPLLVAKRGRTGDFSRDVPFAWGESREAPLYRRLPNAAEQRRTEPELETHLARVEALRSAVAGGNATERARLAALLGGVDTERAAGQPPSFVSVERFSPWFTAHALPDVRARQGSVPARSTVAFTDEFFAEGRSWALTTDLFLVPKDRLVQQPPAVFHGVKLAENRVRLPIAFIRGEPRPKFRLVESVIPASGFEALGEDGFRDDANGSRRQLEQLEETWPRLSWVGLTGRARWERGERYFETTEQGRGASAAARAERGSWIRASDAAVVQARPPEGFELGEGEKWIDVSIFRGTLVAYEGRRPVFATLISPGLRGYARKEGKPTKNTTPTGTFRIEWKHLSTTMSPNPEKMSYYLSEVPFTQFFHMPFALHAAYWHDRFGEPKSGGCVNLSLADARFLFEWTSPKLPPGWHGVRSGEARGPGTWVRVR